MTAGASPGRFQQRHRTRKDLLLAGARLLKQGQRPTLADVAREAKVSRATAYRYFPSIDALLCEAPLDEAVPPPAVVFADMPGGDARQRVERAEAALHEVVYRNAPQLRAMLAFTLKQSLEGVENVPVRQNRRGELIAAALEPVRDALDRGTYQKLSAALALIFGTESMIVFEDVLQLDENTAAEVKRWAIGALVAAALRPPAHAQAGASALALGLDALSDSERE